jgi:hypothetical protein
MCRQSEAIPTRHWRFGNLLDAYSRMPIHLPDKKLDHRTKSAPVTQFFTIFSWRNGEAIFVKGPHSAFTQIRETYATNL